MQQVLLHSIQVFSPQTSNFLHLSKSSLHLALAFSPNPIHSDRYRFKRIRDPRIYLFRKVKSKTVFAALRFLSIHFPQALGLGNVHKSCPTFLMEFKIIEFTFRYTRQNDCPHFFAILIFTDTIWPLNSRFNLNFLFDANFKNWLSNPISWRFLVLLL